MTNEEVSKKTNKLNYTKHIANVVGADASVRPQNQKGITLIALVITIIVMLILVAVTITIAINGGLFGSAKDVKSQTQYVNGTPSKNQNDDSTGGGSEMLSYDATPKDEENGTLTENALWEDEGGKAVIPKGFKVVYGISGEQSIDSGLVIEDAEGNQFVWIPVTYEATGELDEHDLDSGFLAVFYRSDWSNNARTTGLSSNYTEPYSKGTGYPNEAEEYYAMMKSVQDNRGFYIGRYEAGSENPRTSASAGDTTMVVKRDQYPYNYVAWGKAMNDIESEIDSSGHGAVYLSEHMYDGKDVGVTSTLCYGVEWDAMLDFIKDGTHWVTSGSDYYKTWGNYTDNPWTIDRAEAKYYSSSKWNSISEEEGQQKSKDGSTSILLTTGASDSFSAKNIYDVAGNCNEWTMEAYSTFYRVRRGGYYSYDGSSNPASSRVSLYYPYYANDRNLSFRPALYIKNISF